MSPWVVWAVKSGAVLPIERVMNLVLLPETSDEVGFQNVGSFKPCRDRQALRAQELRVEQARLVAGSRVAQHGDDGLSGAKLAGQPDCAGDVDSGRQAEVQPFLLQQR